MTPPRSIIGSILGTPWLRDPLRRRLTFAALAVVLGVLCFFPRTYVAETLLMPQESGGGLSAVLAQQASGAIVDLSALMGNKTSIELDMVVARSEAVIDDVIGKLHLVGKPGFGSLRQAQNALRNKLHMISLHGAVLQVTVADHDPQLAKQLAAAAADAIRDRLAAISLQTATEERAVTTNRLEDASIRLDRAKAALTQFRIENKMPSPQAQLTTGEGLLAGLQGQLQASETALTSLRQIVTDDNIQVVQLKAQIADLQNKIAAAKAAAPGSSQSLQGVAATNLRYYDLNREYMTDEILVQVYSRYLDEIVINEMSARQNLHVIQPAYIQPSGGVNEWAAALLLLVVLTAVGAEFYLATSGPKRA